MPPRNSTPQRSLGANSSHHAGKASVRSSRPLVADMKAQPVGPLPLNSHRAEPGKCKAATRLTHAEPLPKVRSWHAKQADTETTKPKQVSGMSAAVNGAAAGPLHIVKGSQKIGSHRSSHDAEAPAAGKGSVLPREGGRLMRQKRGRRRQPTCTPTLRWRSGARAQRAAAPSSPPAGASASGGAAARRGWGGARTRGARAAARRAAARGPAARTCTKTAGNTQTLKSCKPNPLLSAYASAPGRAHAQRSWGGVREAEVRGGPRGACFDQMQDRQCWAPTGRTSTSMHA